MKRGCIFSANSVPSVRSVYTARCYSSGSVIPGRRTVVLKTTDPYALERQPNLIFAEWLTDTHVVVDYCETDDKEPRHRLGDDNVGGSWKRWIETDSTKTKT